MRNGTKKHKNATEYDKKKQETRKSKSIKIHMTAVDMVNCESHRTRAEQNANMFLN